MSEDNKWYVLRVISGKEKKLREVIEKEIKLSGWSEVIPQVIVPTEKVYKLKGGKKVIQEKNFFPGYLMMEADSKKFNADIVQHIQNNKFAGFADLKKTLSAKIQRSEWLNTGGQLIQRSAIDTLRRNIKSGKTKSWDECLIKHSSQLFV